MKTLLIYGAVGGVIAHRTESGGRDVPGFGGEHA
jgi:hypothetical protein